MPEKRKADEMSNSENQALVIKKQVSEDGALVASNKTAANSQIQIRGVSRTSSLYAPIMHLTGHGGIVYALDFSPDGTMLASASFDKTICKQGGHTLAHLLTKRSHTALWNVFGPTCDNFAVLKGHRNAVLDVTFSRSGTALFSCSADRSACLWDVETGARTRKFAEHRAVVNAGATAPGSPDRCASVSDDCTLKLWDARQKASTLTVSHKFPLTAVTFGADDTTLLAGGIDNVVRAYDTRKGGNVMLELFAHDDTVSGLALSRDGGLLLSNSFDCTLRLWDVKPYCAGQRNLKTYMGHEHSVDKNLLRCSIAPDLSMVAAGSSDRMVYVWNYATAKILYRLPGHTGSVNDVIFHPHEPIIASCSNDKSIYLGEIEQT